MENLICVDTDIIIDHLKGKGPGVEVFAKIVKEATPFTTHINKFELLCGARDKREIQIIEDCLCGFTLLPFDNPGSLVAANIYRELIRKGEPIGIRDIMIAGIAISKHIPLATKNIREFEKVKNLKMFEVR